VKPARLFLVFLGLGCRAFGGPIAHLAVFRHEFVERRAWLGERDYADLVALCQFLPGPTSSQVGMLIGWRQAGGAGLLAAWLGFTLPAACLMIAAGLTINQLNVATAAPWLHGMQIAVLAIVAGALATMWRGLCTDRWRAALALVTAAAVLAAPQAWMQLPILACAGILGYWLPATASDDRTEPAIATPSRPLVLLCIAVLAAGLLALPLLSCEWGRTVSDLFRTGSLVIGGGHVVLPLLSGALIDTGRMSTDTLLAGYGVAQIVPGPMFSIAGFIGTVLHGPWFGALAIGAIFLPGGLLAVAALPMWERLRRQRTARRIADGLCAGVVGLLLAALYDPIAAHALRHAGDAALACLAIAAVVWRVPPWLIVPACAAWTGLRG